MTREDVLRGFTSKEYSHVTGIASIDTDAMADEIVRLRAALAAAPKVTVVDGWAVVNDENWEIDRYDDKDIADSFAAWANANVGYNYTVRRVALLDEPTTGGVSGERY